MKSNSPNYGVLVPQAECKIWDEFCDDHELLERLRVTPQELDALKNCVLLGTITCQQDVLFILQQIRIATGPSSEETTVSPAPAPPGSLAALARFRLIELFGGLCWALGLRRKNPSNTQS